MPDTSDSSATRATQVRHEPDTSNTSAIWVTQVKKFDFDNHTIENIFSHLYISYMANETLQRKIEFHSQNYLLEMPRSHAKMRFKSTLQKLNFVMAKAKSKSYTRYYSSKCHWSRIIVHCNAASFFIKTMLYESNNIFCLTRPIEN